MFVFRKTYRQEPLLSLFLSRDGSFYTNWIPSEHKTLKTFWNLWILNQSFESFVFLLRLFVFLSYLQVYVR